MNLLLLDQFATLGGAQLCFLDLLPALDAAGIGVRALLPGAGAFATRLRERGVGVDYLRCGAYRDGAKGLGDVVRLARELPAQVRAVRSAEADLVYVNGPRLLAAAALAIPRGMPVLYHAHNRLHGPSLALAGRAVTHARMQVIACSAGIASSLPGAAVVNNGTADMRFRERRFDGTHWRIGIIGRICPEKGQQDFLRAAKLLGDDRVHWVVCGAGERMDAHGLAVEFTGWRDDIAAVLRDLDLLVVASREEGFPRVVLEAFSAGVPVVAYAALGVAELIAHGSTGFLTAQRTPEALAAMLRELIDGDAAVLRRVARNARGEWESRYTLTHYRERMLPLIQRAAARGRAVSETAGPRQSIAARR